MPLAHNFFASTLFVLYAAAETQEDSTTEEPMAHAEPPCLCEWYCGDAGVEGHASPSDAPIETR